MSATVTVLPDDMDSGVNLVGLVRGASVAIGRRVALDSERVDLTAAHLLADELLAALGHRERDATATRRLADYLVGLADVAEGHAEPPQGGSPNV